MERWVDNTIGAPAVGCGSWAGDARAQARGQAWAGADGFHWQRTGGAVVAGEDL
jgi:hypothetical protein